MPDLAGYLSSCCGHREAQEQLTLKLMTIGNPGQPNLPGKWQAAGKLPVQGRCQPCRSVGWRSQGRVNGGWCGNPQKHCCSDLAERGHTVHSLVQKRDISSEPVNKAVTVTTAVLYTLCSPIQKVHLVVDHFLRQCQWQCFTHNGTYQPFRVL